MQAVDFNRDWYVAKQGEAPVAVTLPHDAMIHEKRQPDHVGGSQHGFFPGGIYEYTKTFDAPEDWREKTVSFHFGGIYKNASVYLNGEKLAFRPYGYVPFTVCADGHLNYGGRNELKVIADNSQLPNSRWYCGSGIYRPVKLLLASKAHILHQGVKITTLSYAPAKIRVQTEATGGDVSFEILDGETVVATGKGTDTTLEIANAKLWNGETPNLYTCRVTLVENGTVTDTEEVKFGIRKIEWSNKGLFVNGKETLLRGGCVHHDNGILGACSFPEAEWRKAKIMKESGFNAIRSAHNPCSPDLLDACDALGLYMMDETFDHWYQAKNAYDYHLDFERWWQEDTKAMVERDYNHPSVILYSIGNEVSEPCEQRGVETGKVQVDFIHSLDASRPVTCGTNLMIISRAAKGIGIYQEPEKNEEKKRNAANTDHQNASLMFNIMASMIGTGMNKAGNSSKVDKLVSPFVDCLDIAGYNYASGRYKMDGTLHPDRVIFGSETFPQDICKNWKMVEKYPYLVGDFMWAGWDYLGEAGVGAWSYEGGLPFAQPYPWVLAGSGVINILGIPDGSCRYAATVWGQGKHPYIAVKPANHPGVKPTKSVWRGTNAIESWAWSGCEGNKTDVEVYARAAKVELILNGKSLGKKAIRDYKAIFKVRYAPGTLEAIAYDASGKELGRHSLSSAEGGLMISAIPEADTAAPGQIVYIPVNITGGNGVTESNADRDLTVTVEGGELLAFGSGRPDTPQCYDSGTFSTYYGQALAVVRSMEKGTITVTVQGSGLKPVQTKIAIK